MPVLLPELIPVRAATPERPLEGQTVLVVEDSRFACEALRLMCLRSGARIRRADSLRAARRHLQAFRPSIVIVDLGLPDGPGETLIEELVQATPRIGAVVGLSGDDGAEGRARAAGADAFLAKPLASLSTFQTTLTAALPDCKIVPIRRREDPIAPDPLSVRDDLARIEEVLSSAGAESLDYVAQFLTGLARSAQDGELAEAAQDLLWHRAAGLPADRARAHLSALISDRLGALRTAAIA